LVDFNRCHQPIADRLIDPVDREAAPDFADRLQATQGCVHDRGCVHNRAPGDMPYIYRHIAAMQPFGRVPPDAIGRASAGGAKNDKLMTSPACDCIATRFIPNPAISSIQDLP
jgi:hypothetical protein